MNKKQIENTQKSKTRLLAGIKILHDSVASTLGPSGRNVIIEDDQGNIQITKDGVTVAKAITVENNIHDLGIRLIKQAASDVNDKAGDGTTTATILAYHLVKSGIFNINMDLNSIEIQRGINQAVKYISSLLKKHSKDISKNERQKNGG